MKVVHLSFFALLLPFAAAGQDSASKPVMENDYRMAFSPWMLFADRASYTNFNGIKAAGIAPGLQVSYLGGWGIGEGEPGTFDGGGYARFHVGFGQVKVADPNGEYKKNWIPYDLSIGPYGSYVFRNAAHEAGFEYGIIGIYGYSVYAYFGSQLTLKYRYRFLQLDATRGGDGIFRGCFVPRFSSAASHSIGLTVHLPKKILAGIRYSKIPNGGAINSAAANEMRLFVGWNVGSL